MSGAESMTVKLLTAAYRVTYTLTPLVIVCDGNEANETIMLIKRIKVFEKHVCIGRGKWIMTGTVESYWLFGFILLYSKQKLTEWGRVL